jgi:hypothetical protein
MRLVFEQPAMAAARARKAQQRARRQFSPSRTVRAMHGRLAAVDRLRHQDQTPAGVRPGHRLASAG